jgi:hypothetical protein
MFPTPVLLIRAFHPPWLDGGHKNSSSLRSIAETLRFGVVDPAADESLWINGQTRDLRPASTAR